MLNSRDIGLLRSDVQSGCREMIKRAKEKGIDLIITSTVRDDAYQMQLYAQGRTDSGSIVTHLRYPTFHWNKAGLAFDFCPVDKKGTCLWGRPDLFKAVGTIAKQLGFTWGGDWKGFVDMPHIQWDNKGQTKNADVRVLKLPPQMDRGWEVKEVENDKKDNKPDPYAVEAVEWALQNGLLRGDEKGNYGLHGLISKQDVIVIAHRIFKQ